MHAPSPVPHTALDTLSERPKQCIERLIVYGQKNGPISWPSIDYPHSKFAAVLIILFEGASGELEVLLTTRATSMRTHGGQTALPGGKADDGEDSPTETAFREAFEEIGLPPSTRNQNVFVVASLPPFLSLHRLIVVPVVALLTEAPLVSALQRTINAEEVDALFVHQFEAVLDTSIMGEPGVNLADKGSPDWPYQDDYYNTSDSEWPVRPGWMYRMHRFRSTHSPVKGLTADILIMAAEIAFDKPTTFERNAPGQRPFNEMIDALVEDHRTQQHAEGPKTEPVT